MSRTPAFRDDPWIRIEALLPVSDGRRGRSFRVHKQVVEGIILAAPLRHYRAEPSCEVRSVADGLKAAVPIRLRGDVGADPRKASGLPARELGIATVPFSVLKPAIQERYASRI